jgi:hypothetical protein
VTGLRLAAYRENFSLTVGFSRYSAIDQCAKADLLLCQPGRLIGVECKRTDAPILTPSMRIALADLKLSALCVVYPGETRYRLAPKVEAVPLAEFAGAK